MSLYLQLILVLRRCFYLELMICSKLRFATKTQNVNLGRKRQIVSFITLSLGTYEVSQDLTSPRGLPWASSPLAF